MSASLIHRIKPFATEGEDNCEVARLGGEQSFPVETQIQLASGECHKVLDGNREVGVTHSSGEGAVMALKRRRGTWSMRTKE